MKKVFVDCRMLMFSGIGVYLRNLVPRIAGAFELTLGGIPDQIEGLGLDGIRIKRFDAPVYSLREQMGYGRAAGPVDVLWTPHYNVPVLPVRARGRVVTVHDLNHLVFSRPMTLKRAYARFMMKRAAFSSDTVITDSRFSRDELVKHTGVNAEKIRTIHLGVDTGLFKRIDRNRAESVREKHSLPGRFILYVGNLKPHKNIGVLLRAFEKMCSNGGNGDFEDINLVIVGVKDGYRTGDERLFQTVESSGLLKERVRFTGYVEDEDLPGIYSLADMLVFPSLYEGFGLPPLEAMACGCPAAVSRCASMPEVCGRAVEYFDPGDSKGLVSIMERVLRNPGERDRLRDKGYARVRAFTWDKTAEAHIAVLREVAGG